MDKTQGYPMNADQGGRYITEAQAEKLGFPGYGTKDDVPQSDAIHGWFSLTYASWLTLPRCVLQSMPDAWQIRFVALLNEMDATCTLNGVLLPERTTVMERLSSGRMARSHLDDYDRGRRMVFTRFPDPTPDPYRTATARLAQALLDADRHGTVVLSLGMTPARLAALQRVAAGCEGSGDLETVGGAGPC